MKSFILGKMGNPHITIAMLGPSLMSSSQTSRLGEEVLLNILPVHQTSHHKIFSYGDTWETKFTLQNLSLFLHFWNNKILIKHYFYNYF